MPHYVVLATFTDQGIRTVRDTAKRAKAFRELATAMRVTIHKIYWVLGPYDVVLTMEAPRDEDVASLMMKAGSLGNLRSQTLRAFGEGEIEALLAQV